jgi:hypothetical protein
VVEAEESKRKDRQRVLAVKLGLDLKKPEDKAIYLRLRDLSWQAMQYGNAHIRAVWAEAAGLRVDPDKGDPHDLTKHIRRTEKQELSGAAYSAIEREARGMWNRYARKILAGASWPQFREGKSLSIRGHAANEAESGVRIRESLGKFFLHLQAQAATCEGGSWIIVPLAKGTEIDDYQAPLLRRMTSWEIPITKATITILPMRGRVVVRLAYATSFILPPVGQRVATLGPISRNGNRLLLRTELDTVDYTSRLATVMQRKDQWDKIRRRAASQIGRSRGSARAKRILLSRMTWDEWLQTYLHQWSNEMVTWCAGQGVGKILVAPINNGDWPAAKFEQMVKYKATDKGIEVAEPDIAEPSTKRAAEGELKRQQRKVKKVREAIRELGHQFNEGVGG